MIETRNKQPVYPGPAYFLTCFCVLIGWRLIPAGIYQPKNWFLYFVGGVFYLCAFRMFINAIRGSYHQFKHKRIKSKLSNRLRPARFSTLRDLKKAKMLKPELNSILLGSVQRRPIYHAGKGHILTIAKPRTGKTTSCAINAILHNMNSSMVISDPKGEIAAITLEHRRKFSDCYVINPFNLFPDILPNHRLNPFMMFINDLHPDRIHNLKYDIDNTCLQLIPEPADNGNGGQSNGEFFRANGRQILSGIILGLVLLRDPHACTLANALSILLSEDKFLELIEKMAKMIEFDGSVQNIADDLITSMMNSKETKSNLWFDFISHSKSALNIFSPIAPIAYSTSRSDFRPEQLKEGPTTIYIGFPGEHADVLGPVTGLMINYFIRAVIRARSSTPVLFILDEFNTFKLPHITTYLNQLPGYGVRCWMMAHGISAIRKAYGKDDLNTILSSSEVLQVFGNMTDPELSKDISYALGNMAIKTQSPHVDDIQQTVTYNYAESHHPLQSNSELRMLEANEQITFCKNLPPIRGRHPAYFDIHPFRKWASKHPMEQGPLPKVNRKDKLVFKYS